MTLASPCSLQCIIHSNQPAGRKQKPPAIDHTHHPLAANAVVSDCYRGRGRPGRVSVWTHQWSIPCMNGGGMRSIDHLGTTQSEDWTSPFVLYVSFMPLLQMGRHQQATNPRSLARRFKCYLLQSNQEPVKCLIPAATTTRRAACCTYYCSTVCCVGVTIPSFLLQTFLAALALTYYYM